MQNRNRGGKEKFESKKSESKILKKKENGKRGSRKRNADE